LSELFALVRRAIYTFRRKFTEFRNLPIWFEIETNARFDGDVIMEYFNREQIFRSVMHNDGDIDLGEMVFPCDPSGRIKRVGIVKTLPRTKNMVMYTNDVLTRNALKIYEKFTSSHQRLDPARVLKEARSEMERFSWPDVDDENIRYKKRKITGKVFGKCDDNAIAIQMNVYYAKIRDMEKDAISDFRKMHDNSIDD